jgi:hypothetical protein
LWNEVKEIEEIKEVKEKQSFKDAVILSEATEGSDPVGKDLNSMVKRA